MVGSVMFVVVVFLFCNNQKNDRAQAQQGKVWQKHGTAAAAAGPSSDRSDRKHRYDSTDYSTVQYQYSKCN